jgi:glutamyl-tRNA reductase
MSGTGMERDILIVGVSHRGAEVDVRERLAFSTNGALEAGLRRLAAEAGLDEAVIVSTCNRVEVVACVPDVEAAGRSIENVLAEHQRVTRDVFVPHLYRLRGREAVRHLFRVAAGLDSMVVGEPQILGQLKASYAVAASAGTSGPVLHRCFHRAFGVAKRVRHETAIATRAVSVASAAVELARSIFDSLEGRMAMLIGAGEMSALTARHLLARGVRAPLVTNRTFERAVELAYECGGTPVPFEEFARYLHLADLVVGAAGDGQRLLTREAVQQALRARKQAPMLLVDLAVPRAFEPEINELDNVYLYDIDDLERVAHDNRDERHREALKAEVIVTEAVDRFWRWLETLEAVPLIVSLREKVEGIRARETARTSALLGSLTREQREAVDYLTRAIVNKILHGPTTRLRDRAVVRRDARFVEAVRVLFGLDDDDRSEDIDE